MQLPKSSITCNNLCALVSSLSTKKHIELQKEVLVIYSPHFVAQTTHTLTKLRIFISIGGKISTGKIAGYIAFFLTEIDGNGA